MEVTAETVRSGRTEINIKSAKQMGKELFCKTFKGKLSDDIDQVWSAINGEDAKAEETKTKKAPKQSHQDKLSDEMEKK